MKRALPVLLLSCGAPAGGWDIDWRGFPPIDRADRAIEIVLEHAPCAPRGGWYGGRVSFWRIPFLCGAPEPVLVSGCMPAGPYLPSFAVGYADPLSTSTLPDEIGHYTWLSCGVGLGEDAGGAYTADFVAWLGEVRAAMRAEGL